MIETVVSFQPSETQAWEEKKQSTKSFDVSRFPAVIKKFHVIESWPTYKPNSMSIPTAILQAQLASFRSWHQESNPLFAKTMIVLSLKEKISTLFKRSVKKLVEENLLFLPMVKS